ncbi:hypothetical protein PybrP1_008811 [[Pythium] brassicae (nom. inval.)]|nr:hypothetical protein PybrP1_008811 [[Pythium] brassicae (nom. inval.)]
MPVPKSVTSSTVLVHGGGRDNARCKHTEWVAARVPLEAHTSVVGASAGPIHETVLSRYDPELDDTLLLEGLITNFFVVKSGRVYTAADGVLLGSTRALVLRACEELGIPVVLAPPRLSERASWTGAFVTSAVRVAVSVTRVLFTTTGHDGIQELQLADVDGVAERIRQHIASRRFFLADSDGC